MNAVETSRTESQRRRPHSLVHARGGQNRGDAAHPLTVLIRVPNLDAPRPALSATAEAKPQTAPANESAAPVATRTSPHTAPATARTPSAKTAGHYVGWAWRMMILAAAVGLVMLAYRIINGPAHSPDAEPAPTTANIVADGNNANPPAPPAPLAPQASEIAAPSTLAPSKLELETPPVQVAPVDAGEMKLPTDNAANIADRGEASADERRPWATGLRMEQPRGDDSIRTARSEWNDTGDRIAPNSQAPNTAAPRGPQQNGAEVPYYDTYESTGDGADYDYPETSPQSYRDEGQWESTPRGAAPRGDASSYVPPPSYDATQYGETAPGYGSSYGRTQYGNSQYNNSQYSNTGHPAWSEPTHSAMRPSDPGVARLHGEIEQPPLRRDDERNRPGVY